MRLALDAMGGDDAPAAMVAGALDFAEIFNNTKSSWLANGQPLRPALRSCNLSLPKAISIHHADDVIGMADKIAALKEKPNDSMATAAKLVKAGDADAMILCGNTACSVAVAQLHLRRIKGVARAGILTPLPNVGPSGHTWVVDCGANAIGKPITSRSGLKWQPRFCRRFVILLNRLLACSISVAKMARVLSSPTETLALLANDQSTCWVTLKAMISLKAR